MLFKDVLVSLRKSEHLNQKELADKLGIARSTVAGYEQGKRFPRFEDLENIADYFNVDMDYLLGKSNIKRRTDYSSLENQYELDACLGKISAIGSDLDLKIIRNLLKLNDDQKQTLADFLETMTRE